jgi:Zinc-finger of the MIZ type in Nse subunit
MVYEHNDRHISHQRSTMPALPLVTRQPPVAPLNADAQQALTDLQRQQKNTKRLVHHLTQAADQLAVVADQLNDRGINYGIDYRKKRRRADANNEEEDPHEKAQYEDFQSKVQELTRRMDNGVRNIVDDQVWVDSLPEAMKQIIRKVEASAEAAQRQTQPVIGEDEDEPATTYPAPPTAEDVPSALLKAVRQDLATAWSDKTLTERYSQNNTYVGFYRTVHDARNPDGDGAPIPHHSLWFANEEDVNPSYVPPGTQPKRTRRRGPSNEHASGDEDATNSSDVEIAREKISIKCPITYLPFTDPLTSTKCPHSFDRPGIMDMLRRTQTTLPLTDAQVAEVSRIRDQRARTTKVKELQPPAIQCPVCTILLTKDDFRPDPALLRKVQRIQAAEAREREAATSDIDPDSDADDDDEDGDETVGSGRGTQGRAVASPPEPSAKKRGWEIKKERAKRKSRGVSRVPATQLGGDEEEDEELSGG